jgi:transcription initiation factor TFIID TATA-box-binding protein
MSRSINDILSATIYLKRNATSGTQPSSSLNNQTITYYQSNPDAYAKNYYSQNNENQFSDFNILPQNDQGQNLEEETPITNINVEKNSREFEKEGNQMEVKDIQLSKTIFETKNTTNEKNFNKVEKIPEINNIVSTVELDCKLNLKEIALQVDNVKYNPRRFPALFMVIEKPKATALIFDTGKMVCLGTKTEEESKTACRKFAKIIKKLNYNVSLRNFKMQNIVGTFKLKYKLPLQKILNHINKVEKKPNIAHYEPQIFPGLIYHYTLQNINTDDEGEKIPNIVFLMYSSGNIVITGAKKRNQIYDAFSQIYPLLDKLKNG